MRHIVFYLVLVCGLFFYQGKAVAENSQPLRKLVVPVSLDKWKCPALEGTFADEMRYMLRLNNRYTLNKCYKEINRFQDQTGEYFDLGGKT